ncbi:MAG: tRNA epoxyqueuosine(34) reductase QueG [Sphingomonadaceae bacterium]|nr:tRNA epoxyqueuosine(34) reductase QueG [Sphingomonadaceae bacterium]
MTSWISDFVIPPRARLGEDLKAGLRAQAHALGFEAFGVARADACERAGARLRAWLADGCHGDMLWMETNAHRRAAPPALWPEVRSIVALGKSYAPALDPLRHLDQPEVGVVSVYALGEDYHDVIKPRLKQLARWLCTQLPGSDAKVFVDTAPVMEKPLAAAAGLGWQGKHTNLLSREHGSWLFLAAILSTAELPPDAPEAGSCGSCTRCLTACPTNAFPAPYRLDARRCISYLTIEHKGQIPQEYRRAIGNRIYGCDDCLAVCPWNKFAAASRELAFAPRAELTAPLLADLLALDDAAFRRAFAGSPIKRIGRDRFVRNVCIAAGNSGDAALTPALAALTDDPSPVVAEAAQWALAQLRP